MTDWEKKHAKIDEILEANHHVILARRYCKTGDPDWAILREITAKLHEMTERNLDELEKMDYEGEKS